MRFNTFSLILAIFIAFAMIGQAETSVQKHERKLAKLQQKLEKERTERAFKAEENQIKGQISRERNEDAQPDLKAALGLSCSTTEDYNRVVIEPVLASELEHWNGGGVKGLLFRRYVMVHRAKNPYTNMTVNITTAGELAVANMCPGGSITLVQSMPPLYGGYQMRVIWTAEGVVDGRLAYGYNTPGTLYEGWFNSESVANRPPWVMNLSRVDKKF